MQSTYPSDLFVPVVGTFHPSRQGSLFSPQSLLGLSIGFDWRMLDSIRLCELMNHSKIDPKYSSHNLFFESNFLLRLDADEPMLSLSTHCDVLDGSFDLLTLEHTHPAYFRKIDPVSSKFESLWVPEAVLTASLFETRHLLAGLFDVQTILKRPVQVFEGLLKDLRMGLLEPQGSLFLLPGLELAAKLCIPKYGLLLFKEVQVKS